jgi:hypothetical protein
VYSYKSKGVKLSTRLDERVSFVEGAHYTYLKASGCAESRDKNKESTLSTFTITHEVLRIYS